jgi:hypothetical protein
MSLADLSGTCDVVTAAAVAEVPDDKPAICGTVTIQCIDGEETLRLSIPMLDALLLLNSLRFIEKQFGLQQWAARMGCSAELMEEMAEELQLYSEEMAVEGMAIN